jgi:carbonic anhydrase
MSDIQPLLQLNRTWAHRMTEEDPDFFRRMSRQQSPQYLWVGCSDSRVPANTIVGLHPGEVFVHRNLANLIKQADMNCLSVMQFAIDVLKVRHVIVCGHYGCSGVRAAMLGDRVGLSDNWLAQIRWVCAKHHHALEQARGTDARHRLLCELNVMEQVANACETTVVRDAWSRGQPLTVHGLIYGVEDGLLRDLEVSCSGPLRH